MFKTKIKIWLILTAFMSLAVNAYPVFATAIYNQDCTLGVFSYDIGPNSKEFIDDKSNQYDKYIQYLPNECKKHLDYPEKSAQGMPYQHPDVPVYNDNHVQSLAELDHVRMPWAEHEHAYFNGKDATKEDFYYKSFLKKFEIEIQPDGIKNLNFGNGQSIDNLNCNIETPLGYLGNDQNKIKKTVADLLDCSGTVDDTNFWGGVSISKKYATLKNGQKGIIVTWEYGTKDMYKMPEIFANNGNGGDGKGFRIYIKNGNSTQVDLNNYQTLTLSDPYHRDAQFGVHFLTKNQPNGANIWSATTTSRALIADFAMYKKNYPQNFLKGCVSNDATNAESGWCQTYPDNYKSYEKSLVNKNFFYWFPIGSVGTIWKTPLAPSQPLACTGLTLNPSSWVAGKPTTFTVTPTFSDNKNHNLDYEWKASHWFGDSEKFFDVNLNPEKILPIPAADSLAPNDSKISPIPAADSLAPNDNKISPTPAADSIKPNVKDIKIDKKLPIKIPGGANLLGANLLAALGNNQNAAQKPASEKAANLARTPALPTDLLGLGFFTDNANTFDYGNPYTDIDNNSQFGPVDDTSTYYTGSKGQVPVLITVKAVNPREAIDLTKCQAQLVIPVLPTPGKVCNSLKIYRNGQEFPGAISINDPANPTDKLTLKVDKSAGLDLDYTWEAKSGNTTTGTFSGVKAKGPANPLTSTDETDPTTYKGPSQNAITKVKVNAYNTADKSKTTLCSDEFIMTPPGITPNVCTALNLTVNGTPVSSFNNFQPGQSYTLAVNPTNQKAPNPNQVKWNEQGDGTLKPVAGSPASCAVSNVPANGNTQFTAPANCKYIYTAAAGGSVFAEVVNDIDPSISVPDVCKASFTVPRPPEEQVCQNLTLIPQGNNKYCVSTNPGEYATQTVWGTSNGANLTTTDNGTCVIAPPTDSGYTLTVNVPGQSNCQAQTPIAPLPPPPPPRIVKEVMSNQMDGFRKVVSIAPLDVAPQNNIVHYRLTFTPGAANTTATITDPIANGIQGKLLPEGYGPGGKIVYANNLNVSVPPCLNSTSSNCYTGDIGNFAGLKLVRVNQPVTITYDGRIINSKINDDSCQNLGYCEEFFENRATIINSQVERESDIYIYRQNFESNVVRVQIFCQYILSRASGDIFLETDLNAGINVYRCFPYKSTTGTITTIITTPPIVPKTGAGEIVTIDHEVCAQGTTGEIGKLYGQGDKDSKGLSSQICEIKLGGSAGQLATKETYTNSIKENVKRVARWEPNLEKNAGSSTSVITSITNADQQSTGINLDGVYHKKGGNLFVGGEGNFMKDGDGAKTFIVENGDLYITKDIKIGGCENYCSPRETAALAFVVLNGNVYIAPDVKEVDAVIFVQGNTNNKGQVKSGRYINGKATEEVSLKQLVVKGSIYGDIKPLLKKRVYAGDPALNEGSIVIRTDERIFINTPPGLQDLVDVKSEITAN